MSEFRYKAFISYSHRDEAWGRWLQKALEGYRIPRHLIGRKGEYGTVPARLSPVFRDREDLSSGADISSRVKEELDVSETLVVICSPAAVASEWVNREIQYFRSLGRTERIYALIVDGDPQATEPSERCFPPALLLEADGSDQEPLAADVRKWADGKQLARLKLIAGILGIRLDDLRRRDMQRRHRVMMVSMGSALVIAVIMTVLAVMAITARDAAENRREHAENLVGYMVGDLKSKLDEVGRLDILEGMGGKVSEYLKTLDPSEVTDESLNQQAQVWRQLGQVSMDQGDLAKAGQAFSASRDILGELHRRNPASAEFLYELGNAEFWVGYVRLELGEFDPAQTAFEAYLKYADMLVSMEPDNPEWMMEKSYAHSNIAALVNRSGEGDAQLALSHIKSSVEFNRLALQQDPDNSEYWSEYSSALAWQADTQLLSCDLGGALVSRRENVEIARGQAEKARGNMNYQARYAYSLTGYSSVAAQVGLIETALQSASQSREILGRLAVLEPSNIDYRFESLVRDADVARLTAEQGDLAGSLSRMEQIFEPLHDVLLSESFESLRRHTHWIAYLLSYSEMLWQSGQADRARDLTMQALDQLETLLSSESSPDAFLNQFMSARFISWLQDGQDILESERFSGIDLALESNETSCLGLSMMFLQGIIAGDLGRATVLSDRLLSQGYYEPRFIRICKQYNLCQ